VENNGKKGAMFWDLIPIPLFLAFISAASYLLAFYFEKGYFDAFGIPSDLIDVQLNTVLLFVAISIGLLTFLFPMLNLLIIVLSNYVHPALARAVLPIACVFLLILILIYIQFPVSSWAIWIALLVFFSFLQLVFPLLTQRNTRGYYAKLIAQEEHESKITSLSNISKDPHVGTMMLFVGLVLIGTSIAWFIGQSQAINKTSYLSLASDPDMLVVRAYSDRVILVRFDEKTDAWLSEFEILPTDSSGIRLRERNLSASPLLAGSHPTETPHPTHDGETPIESLTPEH
jgi:hypothetical protein